MIRSGISRKTTTNGAPSAKVSDAARFWALQRRLFVAAGDQARHLSQEHRAGRDDDHAAGQLIEPVGVADRREAAGRQERADDLVGERADLVARGNADRRSEHPEELAHLGCPPRPHQAFEQAPAARVDHRDDELSRARGEEAPAGHARDARRYAREPGGPGEEGDHADVGRGGGGGRHAPGIVGVRAFPGAGRTPR